MYELMSRREIKLSGERKMSILKEVQDDYVDDNIMMIRDLPYKHFLQLLNCFQN